MNMKEEDVDEFGAMDRELEVGKGKFEALSEGTYECEYLGTTIKVGEDEDEFFVHKWKEVETEKWITETSSLTLSEKSKLGDIFRACGFEVKEGARLYMKDLVGKKCQLYVIIENGYNKVKTHIPLKNDKKKNSQTILG